MCIYTCIYRSAALLMLKKFDDALSDCKKAIELDPAFIKGYIRASKCQMQQGKLREAQMVREREPARASEPERTRDETRMRVCACVRACVYLICIHTYAHVYRCWRTACAPTLATQTPKRSCKLSKAARATGKRRMNILTRTILIARAISSTEFPFCVRILPTC